MQNKLRIELVRILDTNAIGISGFDQDCIVVSTKYYEMYDNSNWQDPPDYHEGQWTRKGYDEIKIEIFYISPQTGEIFETGFSFTGYEIEICNYSYGQRSFISDEGNFLQTYHLNYKGGIVLELKRYKHAKNINYSENYEEKIINIPEEFLNIYNYYRKYIYIINR